jgi:hypothetical protein
LEEKNRRNGVIRLSAFCQNGLFGNMSVHRQMIFFCFIFQSGIKSMEYDLVAKENLELKEKLEKVISKVRFG